MSYLSEEEKKEFNNNYDMKPGQKADVIMTGYEPFEFGTEGKKMPKHVGINAETQERIEFVGYAFHAEIGKISDDIEENITVLAIECVENESKYPDYVVTIKEGGAPVESTEDEPFK